MTTSNPLLTAILNHQRVRALRPEWYRWICPVCNYGCKETTDQCTFGNRESDYQPVKPITPVREYTGPDLARPDQLHELLGLADAICKPPHRTNVEWNIGDEDFCAHFNSCNAYGPTRTAALIAAIARALEVEK